MSHIESAEAVRLLDLTLAFFAEDSHWARGRYNDGNGGRCLLGAVIDIARQHRLPAAPAIALLQDAMPHRGLPLVHFNDTRCGSIAELRALILRARRLADKVAERERAAAAAETWLRTEIEKSRAKTAAAETAEKVPSSQILLAA